MYIIKAWYFSQKKRQQVEQKFHGTDRQNAEIRKTLWEKHHKDCKLRQVIYPE